MHYLEFWKYKLRRRKCRHGKTNFLLNIFFFYIQIVALMEKNITSPVQQKLKKNCQLQLKNVKPFLKFPIGNIYMFLLAISKRVFVLDL